MGVHVTVSSIGSMSDAELLTLDWRFRRIPQFKTHIAAAQRRHDERLRRAVRAIETAERRPTTERLLVAERLVDRVDNNIHKGNLERRLKIIRTRVG